MRKSFDRYVADFGVTRSLWSLIAVVARRPGTTQRAIAEALEMSEASAGRLVDRLVAEGLLERREREDDRRARAVYLTPKADPLLEQMANMARQREEWMFRGMTEEELEQLRALLEKLHTNLNPGSMNSSAEAS
ncbi:MAG: winged helix-turn-helix transcriptional regulator [Novosphingobium sp.]|nr:winged helix-turn-helix transcriptional regulator [Novosphingobium sp.]